MTQKDLVAKTGFSQGYLADIENARKFPSAETLDKLCIALELRPYELLIEPEDLQNLPSGRSFEEVFSQVQNAVVQAVDETKERIRWVEGPDEREE